MVAMQVMSKVILKNSGTPDLKTREDKQPRSRGKPGKKVIKIPTWSVVNNNKKTCCIMDFVLWLESLSTRGFLCGWGVLDISF